MYIHSQDLLQSCIFQFFAHNYIFWRRANSRFLKSFSFTQQLFACATFTLHTSIALCDFFQTTYKIRQFFRKTNDEKRNMLLNATKKFILLFDLFDTLTFAQQIRTHIRAQILYRLINNQSCRLIKRSLDQQFSFSLFFLPSFVLLFSSNKTYTVIKSHRRIHRLAFPAIYHTTTL